MKPQIHQIVPVLDERDAIGNYVCEIQKLLIKWGYESKIFVWRKQSGQGNRCYHYSKHEKFSAPDNILICHYAISSPVFEHFLGCSDRKIMIYHNITPPEFFRGINDELYFLTKDGRAALRQAEKTIDLALGVSPFNQRELIEAGYPHAKVLPLIIDFELFDRPADQEVVDKYNDGKKNFLFVGRILPNKKQEDVIRCFYYYHNYIDPNSRLFLVGTAAQSPKYRVILERLVENLELDDVIFTASVPHGELLAYFKLADVFLCMSEHEGFCVPLLEAMYLNVPVVAYASSAIPETLGEGGVVVEEKDFAKTATLIDAVLEDEQLQQTILKKQRERLEYFRRENVENMLKQYIEQLTGC